MSKLTDEQRREVWAGYMAECSRTWTPITASKTELRRLIDAADDHLDTAKISDAQLIDLSALGAALSEVEIVQDADKLAMALSVLRSRAAAEGGRV